MPCKCVRFCDHLQVRQEGLMEMGSAGIRGRGRSHGSGNRDRGGGIGTWNGTQAVPYEGIVSGPAVLGWG